MNLFLLQGPALAEYFQKMHFKKIGFLFAMLSSWGAPAMADSANELGSWNEWKEAHSFYDSGKYQEALQSLLQSQNPAHSQNSSYFYNLGTIYFRLGQTGNAVAYLEKANHLHPHDSDIQYNLSKARAKLQTEIGADKIDPSSTWVEQIADRISLDEVRSTLGLLGLMIVLLWTRAYLSTRKIKQALIQPAGLLGVLGFAMTSGIYGIQRWTANHPPAISLKKLAIRSGPSDHYLELYQAEAGTKLRLLGSSSEESEKWLQVRYSSEGIGWARASQLLAL